jgi:hypothetical protein
MRYLEYIFNLLIVANITCKSIKYLVLKWNPYNFIYLINWNKATIEIVELTKNSNIFLKSEYLYYVQNAGGIH